MHDFFGIIKKFSGIKIGVIGDIMLDRYLSGDVERISPEAPAPVVVLREEQFLPGGAANTAANIAALGGKVDLVGLVGCDVAGEALYKVFERYGIGTCGVVRDLQRPTIEKIRVLSRGQQIVRIDREELHMSEHPVEEKLRAAIRALIPTWHALVISDYAKGLMTPRLARDAQKLAEEHHIPVIVDTKPKHFSLFKSVSLLTPNKKESEDIVGKKINTRDDLAYAGSVLRRRSQSDVLVTLGEEGMALFTKKKVHYLPSFAREVFDVTGAGDTVAAVAAMTIAAGGRATDAAQIAGIGAGIVVGKRGTATLTCDELRSAYTSYEVKKKIS